MTDNNQKLYLNRFNVKEVKHKKSIWRPVCRYLEKYLPSHINLIVDVAAGYCDFINNIRCPVCVGGGVR